MSSTVAAPPPQTRTADWRTDIPPAHRRSFRIWFWSIAAMTFGVLVIGGITRLTQSGLSIVDWDPFMGVVPPLSHADWQRTFDAYRQYPEYLQLRQGMTLGEFRFIFFWEYLHRLMARMIGVVFLIPFAYFAVRRRFNRPLALRSIGLFGLGAMQGVMGWIMVASGLVDRPSVSHYRLAAHLSLAFIIFGCAVWLAQEMRVGRSDAIGAGAANGDGTSRARVRRAVALLGVLLGVQVVWGAFVAGLDAGFFLNTFPLMLGSLAPPGLFAFDPPLRNLVENAMTVQWLHRLIGTVLLLAAAAVAFVLRRSRADAGSRRYATSFAALIGVQYVLGVSTLLLSVPVPLGVAHQATAMILFGVWVVWAHHVWSGQSRSAAAS